jgi:hypothetical protein
MSLGENNLIEEAYRRLEAVPTMPLGSRRPRSCDTSLAPDVADQLVEYFR